jgi:hypothetical protein
VRALRRHTPIAVGWARGSTPGFTASFRPSCPALWLSRRDVRSFRSPGWSRPTSATSPTADPR